jgi:hypothetical protein
MMWMHRLIPVLYKKTNVTIWLFKAGSGSEGVTTRCFWRLLHTSGALDGWLRGRGWRLINRRRRKKLGRKTNIELLRILDQFNRKSVLGCMVWSHSLSCGVTCCRVRMGGGGYHWSEVYANKVWACWTVCLSQVSWGLLWAQKRTFEFQNGWEISWLEGDNFCKDMVPLT